MPDRRGFLLWSAACLLATALCMAFVDRPFATFSHDIIHRPPWCVWLTYIAAPAGPFGGAALIGAGVWRLTGRRLDPNWRIVLAAGLATLLALLAVMALKYAFGRYWPETWYHDNPSWIDTKKFGFLPFHGGAGYASFPSGHTARITAPFAVLWHRVPRLRVLWCVPTLLVAAGLLGADVHFVSDCIAGAWLGSVCALLVLRFV
jgi:membrane-associated phospholipid phosphatase